MEALREEQRFITNNGEILNTRVYSDCGVKIEGANMLMFFPTVAEAESYLYKVGVKIADVSQ